METTKDFVFGAFICICAAIIILHFFPDSYSQKKDKLSNTQKCWVDGQTFFQKFYEQNNYLNDNWDLPEYHFDNKKNTCLIYTRYYASLSDGSDQYDEVTDVYSGQSLVYGWFYRDKDSKETVDTLVPDSSVPNYTSGEFYSTKNALFKE